MLFDDCNKKKRVGKACDCCRIKKTKCDGKKPCNRCILDNKICIFTDKKKLYQKTYPSGYVELLETRLNLLTKSLEILLSKNPIYKNFDGINDMVMYLIHNEDLLTNLPIEWEQGAIIAAKFDKNKNYHQSIMKFANNYNRNTHGTSAGAGLGGDDNDDDNDDEDKVKDKNKDKDDSDDMKSILSTESLINNFENQQINERPKHNNNNNNNNNKDNNNCNCSCCNKNRILLSSSNTFENQIQDDQLSNTSPKSPTSRSPEYIRRNCVIQKPARTHKLSIDSSKISLDSSKLCLDTKHNNSSEAKHNNSSETKHINLLDTKQNYLLNTKHNDLLDTKHNDLLDIKYDLLDTKDNDLLDSNNGLFLDSNKMSFDPNNLLKNYPDSLFKNEVSFFPNYEIDNINYQTIDTIEDFGIFEI